MWCSRYLSAFMAALSIYHVAADDPTVQVWSVFSYVRNGDTIPQYLQQAGTLTSYGASQLYAAGSASRDRYVALHEDSGHPGTRIQSISPYLLLNDQIEILATADSSAISSAQAYMQGLYPPLEQLGNETFVNLAFQLANSSIVSPPLGGYQYPQIVTLGLEDPLSIILAGQVNCPAHLWSDFEYLSSSDFWNNWQNSATFYNQLSLSISDEFDTEAANFGNATSILEYVDYQYVHNSTFHEEVTEDDIGRARWYAGKYVWATNGNSSGDGDIRTIAGQTMASSIINAFDSNIEAQGISRMMTLLFGTYEPMVALASIVGLADDQDTNFYSLPTTGASMSFELFSLESDPYPTYPDISKLYVRFVIRNGTDSGSDSSFQSYPLFGYSPSNIGIPYSEFRNQVEKISLGSVQDWCLRCNSTAVFCSGVLNQSQNSGNSGGMKPVVAGVIGAVVTILVLALIVLICVLIYAIRTKKFHRPSLGGFKGDRKMASDSDVTFKNPKWNDPKPTDTQDPGTAGIITGAGATVGRGHERQGSWEMKDHNSSEHAEHPDEEDIGSRSPFGDYPEDEIHLHSAWKPVLAREHV